jgi:hypothetical protein
MRKLKIVDIQRPRDSDAIRVQPSSGGTYSESLSVADQSEK